MHNCVRSLLHRRERSVKRDNFENDFCENSIERMPRRIYVIDGGRRAYFVEFVCLASFCTNFESGLLNARQRWQPHQPVHTHTQRQTDGHMKIHVCWAGAVANTPPHHIQQYYCVQNTQILHFKFMVGQKVHSKFAFLFSLLC